jgi:PAS domain S-box-containing protein
MNFFNLPDNVMENQMQKRIAELEKTNKDLRAENIVLNREVTKRKRAEEALQESEKRYRILHENMRDAFVQVSIDGRIIEFNDLYCKMLGYSPGEMRKLTYQELTPERWHAFEESIVREHVIPRGYSDVYEKEYRRKDGIIIPVEMRTILSRDASGRPNGMWAIVRDITERKRTEEALKKAYETLEEKVKERTAELEKAYNSLRESERGFAQAQKMAHIGNWDNDLIIGKLYWSEEMYRIFGCNPQEGITYDKFLSSTHPEDRNYVYNSTKEALNGKVYATDYRIIRPDGEERIVHSEREVIFDEKNNPVRMRGTVQDITEIKKAEEKIQSLANIVESSQDAIGTISLDGVITSWNKGAEQIYGYSAKEILGKTGDILSPPHLKEETKKLVEQAKKGERIHSYETSRLRKDGTIINVSLIFSPVFDASGKLTAISFIARDITERKKAEEKLQESEARLLRVYKSNIIGVFFYNLDGSIIDANDKLLEIVGYTREDLQAGRINWDKMTPPEYSHLDEHAGTELKATGMNTPYEKEYLRKDGSRVSVIVGVAAFDQSRNEGIAFVLDITERKEAERVLANIEIARKKEIHHRIKNNLQVISSLLDLQAEKFGNRGFIMNSEVLEAVRESQDRVISMALIHEELYKSEGLDTLNFSPYIEELAENLFKTYNLGNAKVSLNLDLEENIFFDMDIAVPLGIIINELVSNSLKHAFSGRDEGKIQIKLNREEKGECKNEGCRSNSFILAVSDDGIGLPENLDIEDIDSLGLQLVTSLVDQLDGELELKRNKGTEFTIRFTVTEKDNPTSALQ